MIHENYEFGNILVGRITSERATVSTRTTTPLPTPKTKKRNIVDPGAQDCNTLKTQENHPG